MRKLTVLSLGLLVALVVSAFGPAMALAEPEPEGWYAFQLNPYIDVIMLNNDLAPWVHGYNTQYDPNTAALGYIQWGKLYLACDLPAGGIEMFFIVIDIATKDGEMMRITDTLELIGPEYVWLTPAGVQSKEGPTLDKDVASRVTPAAWHHLTTNPYIDVVHLNTDLTPWLWGWADVPVGAECYPAPVLGYYEKGHFYMGWDYIDNVGCYAMSFWHGIKRTRDGDFMRITEDLLTLVGPEYFWLTPA